MITYKEYKMLMETVTPTVNLGVATPAAIGGEVGNSFGFKAVDATEDAEDLLASLAEAKKKMFGDEMVDPKDAPAKDSDDDAEEDAADDSDDDMDDKECMTKKCKKSKKEEVEELRAALLEAKKKKCGGEMDMASLLGKGKDGGDDEGGDDEGGGDDDDDGDDEEMEMMKKKSKKENTEFFQSLATQLGEVDRRDNRDGISEYLEDAVFTPKVAGPGDVGFAPEGRIGAVGSYEVGSEEQQALSTNFMGEWDTIKELALGVRENGLQDG
jgi:hypothetical protein